MREILFRGKRIDNGEWVVGIPWIFAPPVNKAVIVYAMGLVGEDDDISRYCECHEVDPSTVGQYTGLTDKNGKKIFEGDIIGANYEGAVGAVRFGEYMSPSDPDFTRNIGYYVDWQGKEKDFLRADLGYWASRSDVEIIGNIHDNFELVNNSELLKDKP